VTRARVCTGLGCALLLAAAVALGSATPARAAWRTVDGECVEVWTFHELVRGPRAVVGVALLPFRSLAGGLWYASSACVSRLACVPVAPLWVLASTVWGSVQGVYWIGAGGLDALTGGTFLLSPPQASDLDLYPVVPFLERRLPEHTEQRCS
jgi:hypothetical protein